MPTTYQIILDIDQSGERNSMPREHWIQRVAVNRFEKFLTKAIDDAVEHRQRMTISIDDVLTTEHSFNTIILNGGRGSGKSTLLRSLITAVQDGTSETEGATSHKFTRVAVLQVIDPSLLETKDHVFTVILALINQLVATSLDATQKNNIKAKSKNWKESLRQLSTGLSRLDGLGKDKPHDEWDDPEFIMEKGLDLAGGSVAFDKSFQDFLSLSLEILDKDIFLIAFDDIDIALNRGWPVLETIRKYLTAPNIQIVLCGDLRLYTTIIRQKQWEHFGESIWHREDTRRPDFLSEVNELEDQYLMKLLKPEYRIDLMRLNMIVKEHTVIVRSKRLPRDETITDFLDQTINNLFRIPTRDVSLYRDFFLRQPIRTVIQFLRAFISSEATTVAGLRAGVEALFAEVCIGSLTRSGIGIDDFLRADSQDVLEILRHFLDRNNLWDAGYRLRPDLLNEEHNLTVIPIALRLTTAIAKEPSVLFDYFVKVCLPHEAYRYVHEMGATMQTYLSFVSRNLHEDSLTEAKQNVAVVVKSKKSEFATSAGTISIYGARRAKEGIAALIGGGNRDNALKVFWEGTGYTPNSKPIRSISENCFTQLEASLEANEVMKSLCKVIACNIISSGNSKAYCSIFNIFGAISHLMKTASSSSRPEESLERSANANSKALDCQRELSRIADSRSHPIPTWGSNMSDQSDDLDQESVDEDENTVETNQTDEPAHANLLMDAFVDWNENLSRVMRESPGSMYFYARVWSRFYYTLVSIDSDVARADKYLGWMMHRYIIAFLSAILVEEVIDSGRKAGSYLLNNPVTDDRAFLSNLGQALSEVGSGSVNTSPVRRFPIFFAVFSCPLWSPFIHPRIKLHQKHGNRLLIDIQTSESAKLLADPVSVHSSDSIKRNLSVKYKTGASAISAEYENLFDPLNSVLLRGRKSTR